MSGQLFGTVVIDRHMTDDDLWLCEPFSRGQAWLDLVLLAQDRNRIVKVRGIDVTLLKGQVGRSVVSLAERWQWTREKTRAFLNDLREARKISFKMDNVATVITVLDYSVFNRDQTAESTPEPTANPAAEPTANLTQNGEQGTKKSEQGTGNEPPVVKNAAALADCVRWFQESAAGYTTEEVTAAWHELTAAAVDGFWVTGRPTRPVADWRSALASELWKRRQIYGQKNSARGAREDGEPPKPMSGKSFINLEAMRA